MGERIRKPYYITTAIAYASSKPYIGNTYEIILADAIARFKREGGYDVYFQTGTDGHGQKIEGKAKDTSMTSQTYVDKVSTEIKYVQDLINISYNRLMRITEPYHEKQVQKISKKLYEQGDTYKSSYEGLYCTPCESFWTKSQPVDGECPTCGREVRPTSEEVYFFRMSKYTDRPIQYIEEHPESIQPASRKNEMMNNFLKPGLQDLCVPHTSSDWGIPIDFAPGHVVYVWLDTLTNYTTGIGYDAGGNSRELYKKYWPADLHLTGKDIVRFHTIYWPIFLMALGEPLPKRVFGHPWLLQAGGKMSKSKGDVFYADDLVAFFGVDPVCYFCPHEISFENDGNISWDLMVERCNADLANVLRNLISRTIAMTNKYFGGVVEKTTAVFSEEEQALDAEFTGTVLTEVKRMREKMDALRVADAVTELWNIFKRCNKYIDETLPWALAKDEAKQGRLKTVPYNLTEALTIGVLPLFSFMPETSEKILKELNTEKQDVEVMTSFGLYPSGNRVAVEAEILFRRLGPKEVEAKLNAETTAEEETFVEVEKTEEVQAAVDVRIPAKPKMGYGAFSQCEFHVCKVLKCEGVPKSKKLLCFRLDCGGEQIQILFGIKEWYPESEKLTGKQAMAIVNLKPARLTGMEPQGTLLPTVDESGNLSLMTTITEGVTSGAEIG